MGDLEFRQPPAVGRGRPFLGMHWRRRLTVRSFVQWNGRTRQPYLKVLREAGGLKPGVDEGTAPQRGDAAILREKDK